MLSCVQDIMRTFQDYQLGMNGFEGAHEWQSEIGRRVRRSCSSALSTRTLHEADGALSRRRWPMHRWSFKAPVITFSHSRFDYRPSPLVRLL